MAVKLNKSDGNELCSVMTKQEIFDIAHPINDVYIQYPYKPDPNILYTTDIEGKPNGIKCTWKYADDSTGKPFFNSCFFRTVGDNAAPFNEPGCSKFYAQSQQLPNVKGTIGAVIATGCSAPFYAISQYDNMGGGRTYGCQNRGIDLSTYDSNTYVNGGEVRPTNLSVRLWIRFE